MTRFLALLLLAITVQAADREQFTLKDGRVIVGTYDEVSQTLTMESPKATLRVDVRDIVKREEAPPAPVQALKVDAAPSIKPTAEGIASLVAASDQQSDAIRKRAKPLLEQYNDLIAQADKADDDFALNWALAANLEPAEVPLLPKDPLQSQIQRKESLDHLNRELETMRNARTAYTTPHRRVISDRSTGTHKEVADARPQVEAIVAADQKTLVNLAKRFLHSDRDLLNLYASTR